MKNEKKLRELYRSYIKCEIYCYIADRAFVYGEEYVLKNKDKILEEFYNMWNKKTDKEKEEGFNRFLEIACKKEDN